MAVTQAQLATQILAQLRMLDPSVSAEVGSPERKILDTIAQALSDAQVDLTQLQGALDIDAKVGTNLDNFLALFGFGRQQAVKASGFVSFSRTTPSATDIRIPSGTQLMAPNVNVQMDGANDVIQNVIYETSFETTLLAGETSVLVPVRAIMAGALGNVAENKITQFGATATFGIDTVTNPAPVSGGIDSEDDDSLKVRFKNTVFRNLAGTQDQFLALAVSTAFTSKVNVVGPLSRYREYVQVPPVADNVAYNVNPETVGPGSATEPGNGIAGEYSTALSTIPYSKHIYDIVPTFVSNGNSGLLSVFYRQDIDWRMNVLPAAKNTGDAYRFANTDIGDPDLQLDISPLDAAALYRPNLTFFNVYTGSESDVTAVRPGDTVLFEHSYLSTASRNDYDRNVTNCIDIFIDGSNDTQASTILPTPGVSTQHAFVTTPATSKYLIDNYRRAGFPDLKPTAGHLYFPLFWQPVTALPSQITVTTLTDTSIFYLNEHYWLVEDTSELYGTIRARNGIEFNAAANGASSVSDIARTGLKLKEFVAGVPMEIDNYTYDRNVVDLQGSLEDAKQVTTDVLVHKARKRYFKLDVTVMYARGANPLQTNTSMQTALNNFLKTQYFGSAIQLSDLLSVLHSVPGIDNVRWSSDIPGASDRNRVAETNAAGVTRVDGSDDVVYNADFFIKDDELPLLAEDIDPDDQDAADAREFMVVPGLIIRSRAQNTWTRA